VPRGDEISLPKRELRQKKNMSFSLGDKHPSYSTVKNWLARFRTGHLSTKDERSGRPTQVILPENMDAIIPSSWMIEEYLPKRQQRLWQYPKKEYIVFMRF
jgi:hypothetical protein